MPPIVTHVRRFALGVLVLFLVGMVVLLWGREWVVERLRRIFSIVFPERTAAMLAGKFDNFSRGMEVLRAPGALLLVIGLSLVSWGMMVVVFALVFVAFHFSLPLSAAALSVALVNLGMIVPSSPGYVGTYEFFVVKSLGAFGIASGPALAFGLVVRLQWYLFEVLVGFACLWLTHLSLAQLSRVTRTDEAAAAHTAARPSARFPSEG